MNKSAEHHAKASRTMRALMERDYVPELKAKLKAIRRRKQSKKSDVNPTQTGKMHPPRSGSRFLCAHQPKPDRLGACLKPRSAAQLHGHAYAFEVHWIEQAIFSLELLSGRPKTIPLVAGMAMDQALLALYKAKGAFDTFSHP